jgi:recombination protein RecA
MGCLVDLAEQTGVILRKGAWYSYEGDNVAQGRDNTVLRLIEDKAFATKVEAQVREKLAISGGAVIVEEAPGLEEEADLEEDLV